MKRCCPWLLAGCLALMGCVPLLQTRPDLVPPPATSEASFIETTPEAKRAPVTAEQVNDTNAREVAKALQDELDREAEAKSRGGKPKPAADQP